MTTDKIKELEARLGYAFKDKELLITCLTHSSYTNEHRHENYERLEFLGDAIIEFIVSEKLYLYGGNEGFMTERRQAIVSASPLEAASNRLGLKDFLLYSGRRENIGKKAISSVFESITAGIYLDGGIEEAKKFVEENLLKRTSENTENNYKGILQELLQSMHEDKPEYITLGKQGKDHAPTFSVKVKAKGFSCMREGRSIREAEQAAARAMLEIIRQEKRK